MLGMILHAAALVLGPGLILNSIRGLFNREGMYDEGSTSQMTLAGWLGILVGIGMTLYGLTMFVPYFD
jgi:hypothetical protein